VVGDCREVRLRQAFPRRRISDQVRNYLAITHIERQTSQEAARWHWETTRHLATIARFQDVNVMLLYSFITRGIHTQAMSYRIKYNCYSFKKLGDVSPETSC